MNTDNSSRQQLHDTALKAPSQSGVYMWHDPSGTVIYVGKAKNLKNRLSSYFSGQKDIKTRILISRAQSIEYITTANEYEAFLLENNLIKKYNPRYNIDLKDGKSYPVLRITNERFPRLFKTRHIFEDGSKYFGPYPDVTALDTFIDALYQRYPLRHCKRFHERETPCMYYHIGRCAAPCCKKIDQETYSEFIDEISRLLEGNTESTLNKIETEMKEAARSLKFEKAARLRDGINALKTLLAQNVVQDFNAEDRDYIAHYQEGELVSFTVLKMRDGRLYGRDNYRTISLNDGDDLMDEFLAAYYTDASAIPPQIFIPSRVNLEMTQRWFSDVFNAKPIITCIALKTDNATKTDNTSSAGGSSAPETDNTSSAGESSVPATDSTSSTDKSSAPETDNTSSAGGSSAPETDNTSSAGGSSAPADAVADGSSSSDKHHVAAMFMAQQNAHEDIIRRLRERGDTPAMKELQELLSLPSMPVRIEGFDIAHIGGKFPVASLISFYNGNPDKKNYRYFRLKTTDGVIDDFASMREATSRRYTRLVNEQADLPDLILIDGGIGQVNAVEGVLAALNLNIPVIGLAKRDEEVYLPGNSTPICLPKRSDALRLLQRVRDETHRFATTRNQRLRTKENTISIFENLPHVGKARAKTLMKAYTSLESFVATADSSAKAKLSAKTESFVSELAQLLKISDLQAQEVIAASRVELEARKAKQKAALTPIHETPSGNDNKLASDLASQALGAGID